MNPYLQLTDLDRRAVSALAERHVEGQSLAGEFYTSDTVWRCDLANVIGPSWLCLGHRSELGQHSSTLVRDLGDISVILTADVNGKVRALANVCRHRGSRILDLGTNQQREIVCPYHGWTYGLDGVCRVARGQDVGSAEVPDVALVEFEVEVFAGLMFVRMSEVEGLSIGEFVANATPFVELHGIKQASVVSRRAYFVNANWKLVVENFRECLHCVGSHESYCAVYEYPNIHEQNGEAACIELTREWGRRLRENHALTGLHSFEHSDWSDAQPHFMRRRQIGAGRMSLTQDGKPAGPLMGSFRTFDGGDTVIVLHPFAALWCANDFAVLFAFYPTGPTTTEVALTWLADAAAARSGRVDVSRAEWLWHTTMLEDQTLIERTQQGVSSPFYRPGRLTDQERSVDWATRWYLQCIARTVASGQPLLASSRPRDDFGIAWAPRSLESDP